VIKWVIVRAAQNFTKGSFSLVQRLRFHVGTQRVTQRGMQRGTWRVTLRGTQRPRMRCARLLVPH